MKLHFLGAAKMVTGSCYMLETNGKKFLIDCGMFQGGKQIRALNRSPFIFNPAELNGVLLSHAHIDHSGLIPRLCKEGFKGPIYATTVTRELCGIMLPDSGHIQEFDAEIFNRKGQRAGEEPVEPIYTVQEAYQALRFFKSIDYDITIQLAPGISARFVDAGHMLGSAVLEIWVTEEGRTTKLVFSGDLGQPDQPLIHNPSLVEDADYLIMESTYGGRQHSNEDKEERLAQIISRTVNRGGNLIIPAFAVGRTQTMLYYLHRLHKAGRIPSVPVVLDSPLAIAATDIFKHHPELYDSESEEKYFSQQEDPMSLPELIISRTSDESKALNNMDRPCIIISASGMLDAGRILHHLKHNLWREEATILLVGYQAQGSLGRRLLEGSPRVKVLGEEINVAAEIASMDGFSAHADQGQIVEWLQHLKTKPANIFVVHGETDNSEPLAKMLESEIGCKTYIPNYLDWVDINGREWVTHQSGFVIIEPAVKQFFERWNMLEDDVRDLKHKMEQAVRQDSSKLAVVIKLLEKIHTAMRKAIGKGKV